MNKFSDLASIISMEIDMIDELLHSDFDEIEEIYLFIAKKNLNLEKFLVKSLSKIDGN